jgi:hypothetical protein
LEKHSPWFWKAFRCEKKYERTSLYERGGCGDDATGITYWDIVDKKYIKIINCDPSKTTILLDPSDLQSFCDDPNSEYYS